LAAPLQHDRFCVVLVSTRNPLNIGAAARAMSNFGFSDLRLVNPYEPSFREARSAVGASEVLESGRVYKSVADAVADCVFVAGTTSGARRDLQQPLEPLEDGAKVTRNQLRAGRVAILFGSEKRGLSNDDLSHCHLLLRIPTREEHGSMNLGQAVAVCLYEFARSSQLPATSKLPENEKPLTSELERVTSLLLEALQLSGYAVATKASQEKLRRMVYHLALSRYDAETWQGMLRQLVWKLKQKI
jgi:TrmH family RNA methyltransferase